MNDEERIEQELERLHLDPDDRGRYWLIRCPTHDDNTKSAQCFKDGWIHCHAGCKRKHINSLVGYTVVDYTKEQETEASSPQEHSKDYTDFWLELQPLRAPVKGVDFHHLNRLGWKEYEGCYGIDGGIFIPYFNFDRTKIPFFQIRHPDGSERRFTFASGSTPIPYGLECIQQMDRWLVVTEGSRDAAILRLCDVPAVALPSASSQRLLERLYGLSRSRGLSLVYAGDRDSAGDKLLANFNHPYIDARTPVGKDVGDLFERYGEEGVKEYYDKYRINKG